MTTPPRSAHDDAPLPPVLATALRGLRRDLAPARDLWPGIAAQLPPRTAAAVTGHPAAPRRGWRHHPRRRDAGYAAAAAAVLAVAIGWQLQPVRNLVHPGADPAEVVATGAAADADAPLLRAADALAREYQGALREVEAARQPPDGPAADAATAAVPGLDRDLEHRAAEVRAALARDPDALHLFHHLQRIYAHRLALSLRQA